MCIKKSTLFLFSAILIASSLSFSCKKDETSGIPAYVKINEVKVVTDLKREGSASSNIADVWFFANGDDLGIFELPCEIPVLRSGNTTLSLFGGIKQSGLSGLRAAYPFYETYKMDTDLVEENTVTISPVLKYKDGTNFPWREGFDDLSFSLDTAPESKVGLVRVTHPDSVKEGKASVGAYMTTENPYFLASSSETYVLPNTGEDVYLEFDYQTNTKIQVHVRSYNTSGQSVLIPIVLVNSKEDDSGKPIWNKMYVFLSPYLPRQANAFQYQIYFESGINTAANSQGYLLLDNIKLVY